MTGTTRTMSEVNNMSSNSDFLTSSTSLDHSLDDHSGYKFHTHESESRYSGTQSDNSHGDTQGSRSRGTSGSRSMLSTVSFTLESHIEYYDYSRTTTNDMSVGTSIEVLFEPGGGIGENGGTDGIRWMGDVHREIIFGSEWIDMLYGEGGQDVIYGFEGDDRIGGGNNSDRIFGDAGDDIIWTGDVGTLGDRSASNPTGTPSEESVTRNATGDGDLGSGGSGNDRLIGTEYIDIFFGGPGHDIIEAGRGADMVYGEGGNDYISALADPNSDGDFSNNEMFGGPGDDYIEIYGNDPTGKNDLHGDEGNDIIIGGYGSDDIYGGDGDDDIDARNGDDEVWGGAGNDILRGGDND